MSSDTVIVEVNFPNGKGCDPKSSQSINIGILTGGNKNGECEGLSEDRPKNTNKDIN